MKLSVVLMALTASLASAAVHAQTFTSDPNGGNSGRVYADVRWGTSFTIGQAATLSNWTIEVLGDPISGSPTATFELFSWSAGATSPPPFSATTFPTSSVGSTIGPVSFAPNIALAAGTYLASVRFDSNGQQLTGIRTSNPNPLAQTSGGLTFTEGRSFQTFNGAWESFSPGSSVIGYSASFTNVTPVPEPSTYALMIAGLGVIGWSARRRQRTAHAAA